MKTNSKNKLSLFTNSKLLIQFIFSLIILIVSFYMVLSKQYSDETNKWAFGMIGLIIGYWLSGKG
jgi:hypothetical protein